MPKISLVYSTFPNAASARSAAKILVGKRLAACAVFFAANSVYFWGKKVKNTHETIAFFKTSLKKSKKLVSELEKIHPYEIPCIIELPSNATKPYFGWVLRAVAAK